MTLKQIAEEAGVSAMTVSNVVNHNDSKVSEKTRKRVQEIIDKYGYVPNMSARSLSAQNSRIIALLLPVFVSRQDLEKITRSDPLLAETIKNTLSDYYASTMVGYLESKLKELGYYIMLRSFYQADEVLELQRNWKVDGCIMLMPTLHDDQNRLIVTGSRCPIVMVDRYYPDLPMLSVGTNDYHGGYLAAQECIRFGHRKLAFIGTTPSSVERSPIIYSRYQGFLAALRDACLPAQDMPVLGFTSNLIGGRDCAEHILKIPAECRPTALVMASDSLAIGAITTFKEHGVRIPDDISIVGYDDLPMSSLVNPPLTTISQDLDAKASAAAALLKMGMENPKLKEERIVLDVKLIQRGTVSWSPESRPR